MRNRSPNAETCVTPKPFHLDPAVGNEASKYRAQFATGDQLVVGTSAECFRRIGAAEKPDDLRCRGLIAKARQIGQRTDGGMACAEHSNGFALVPLPIVSGDVRHSIDDPACTVPFPDCRKPVRARGIGRRPRSRHVDHGVGPQDLRPLAVLKPDFERRVLTASRLCLVESDAADRRHATGCPDDILQRRLGPKGIEIVVEQLAARRIDFRIGGFHPVEASRRAAAPSMLYFQGENS